MGKESKDFDKILLSSIDEAFASLGVLVGRSTYFHLENSFIKREDIPGNLEVFQEDLERIFGVGARSVEILIMRRLFLKISSPLTFNQSEKLDFIRYVELARNSFLGLSSRSSCYRILEI
jgi:hypothetical protein